VTSLAALENASETLHCENDQTKLIVFSRTGMFNLIVKDPCRFPPERAALDREYTAELCVLELAALHWLVPYNLRRRSAFSRIY
jgi:hypothetical protein